MYLKEGSQYVHHHRLVGPLLQGEFHITCGLCHVTVPSVGDGEVQLLLRVVLGHHPVTAHYLPVNVKGNVEDGFKERLLEQTILKVVVLFLFAFNCEHLN